ncbi:MAG: KamA family radical SAM protein [Bacteroidota bacterium]
MNGEFEFERFDQADYTDEDEPPSGGEYEKFIDTANFLENKNQSTRTFSISENTRNFIQEFYPGVTYEEWNSWRWQLKNSITSIKQLSNFIKLTPEEIEAIDNPHHALPLRITPYYASLMGKNNALDPIRRCMVPTINELTLSKGESLDPLEEEHFSPVPNLVHRYPDRVLFLTTGFCSAYCRYCTRSHMVAKDKCHVGIEAWQPALEYIRSHNEVRDVLISGGDPLTMSDSHIEYLLRNLRAIKHVEIIRIGTKVPVVLPQRITYNLLRVLKQYHPLYISIHFTHPAELTPETAEACTRLANAGIPLGSQTVLLKGINDNVDTMKSLMQGLLKIRVRPYYIYQCDPIPGSNHFRTKVSKGIEVIKDLRGFTTGYAVPTFVIDAPGGGGKIPLLPEYYQGEVDGMVILRNYEDKTFYYPNPID